MKKILIVEDDPVVAHIYKSRLEKEGYEVEVSPDGQTGFYRIHEFHPDAVLLDLMLPKMNGVEILKKIRAQPQFTKTPIIVFTNAYVPNMIQEAFQAGATQVFNKATLTPRQVIDALQTAMYLNTGEVPSNAANAGGKTAPAIPAAKPDAPPAPKTPPTPLASPRVTHVHVTPGLQTSTQLPPTARPSTPGPQSGEQPPQDAELQAEVQEAFHVTAPDTLAAIRRLMQDFTKTK